MTLINNPSRTSPIHYKCKPCQVEGYGTECWCCGGDITYKPTVNYETPEWQNAWGWSSSA